MSEIVSTSSDNLNVDLCSGFLGIDINVIFDCIIGGISLQLVSISREEAPFSLGEAGDGNKMGD